MGENTEDQAPAGIFHAVPADDVYDTEGHRRPPNVPPETGPDTIVHAVLTDADAEDTHGHVRGPSVAPEDGPDGVFHAVPTDDEATDG